VGVDAVVIDDHLSDADLGNLFNAIDVYCSLHRAEGFGLGLAESMALGKLAVATNYSGNLDFMKDTNSLLVKWRPSRLTVGDTEHNPGMRQITNIGSTWAEPDHDSAVEALISSFDPNLRERLGEQARRDMDERYSPRAVAEVVEKRLSELNVELRLRRTDWPSRFRA
jgi:glycosyltransferase involved in cell wall biosynthesis